MKKTAKRLLSTALVLVMVLSLLPVSAVPALADESEDSDTKDAFGITMAEWTDAEKTEAEANLPFGTGYGTWTTLLEKNELFFSMGYDNATRLTGMFDWNETVTETGTVDGIPDSAIGSNVIKFTQSQLTSRTENYKAVATAAMDLYGTGKKEYVANLAYDTTDNNLYLYVTDSNNDPIGTTRKYFENVSQLGGLQVHQLNGAFSIAAGDFDGDGKDTIVVYIPQTNGPFIAEYSVNVTYGIGMTYTDYVEKSVVSTNVLTQLGNSSTVKDNDLKNQPMVDLVAEDVDKDGFDELVVTAGMNDVTNSDKQLQSQVFIYDKLSSNTTPPYNTGDGNWNLSYRAYSEDLKAYGLYIKGESNKRVVWASSTVGNIMVSTSTGVDYPEIVTAGFIDGEQSKTQHINVDGDNDIGVTAVRVDETKPIVKTNTFVIPVDGKEMTAVNAICEYKEVLNQKIGANGWTKGGFYESEDVNGLLQVQAYADRGLGSAEAVFISGSVYRINDDDKLEHEYRHDDFKSKDDFAPGGRTLTNTTVTAVTAGNFNGNDEGREQLIFVTSLKQSGKNNAYSRVYCYYYDTDNEKNEGKRSSYLTEHKGNFYVSLAALDTDSDSIIAKLESIERGYSSPDVLAILEAAPYFAEIEGGDIGNSETTYGLGDSSTQGTANRFGFTLGTSVGYEFESTLTQSGAGFELAVENSFNWSTANSTAKNWFTEFRNDSGDNMVVAYRCPVVTYTYKDQNNKTLVVEKVGQPATSMITVEEYNAAAEQNGLDPIDESNANLGEAGNPASYRSNTRGLTNAVQYNGIGNNASSIDTTAGWAQYASSTTSQMQGLEITKEQEKTFSYDMAVSLSVFAKAGGFTASATYGFAYAHEETSIDGSSVTKSGAVHGKQVAGYDFQWKFAAWNCTLNGSTVPVIGYLVRDVVSPPSPAAGLTVESFTTDSVTLRWSSGTRAAEQYRIYRVLENGTHVLVGAVQGDQTTITLTGLEPRETYTYVVRGVGYNSAGKALESVDSVSVTVRTQLADGNVTLSLFGSSLTGSTLKSTGENASLSVQVTGTGAGNLSYQWQIFEPGNEGTKNGWRSVNSLPSSAIGTVADATSGTLTLKNIDKSLNGSYLRCVVTVISTAGNVDTYYSPIATLDLNGLDTNTAVTVTGKTGGSGSITAPYTGTADHEVVSASSSVGIKLVPATVPDDQGREYTIYQDTSNDVYVGVYDDVNIVAGDADTCSRTYRAVTESGAAYSLDDELTLSGEQYLTDDSSEYKTDSYVGFDGVRPVSETVGTGDNAVTYVKLYVVAGTTLTEYWRSTADGLYYAKNGTDFKLPDSQPDKTVDEDGNVYETNADLRMVYYDEGGTVILSADGDKDYDYYQVYTADGDSYKKGASFYRVPSTKLYKSGEDEPYADTANLKTVTVEQQVEQVTYTTTQASGTQLTLQAAVKDQNSNVVSTQVTFTITNTDTGAVTLITTTSGTQITWTAPRYGLYRIVATAAATNTTKSSSAECYYRADDPNINYRLTVRQAGEQVTNISYNGATVKLMPEKRTSPDSPWSDFSGSVTYLVNGKSLGEGVSEYRPTAAGTYIFSAVVDGKLVASAVLVVDKVSITVTPEWDSPEGATNAVPAYGDIKLVVTDAQGNTISGLVENVMTVSCDLYKNGALDASAEPGVYTVTPDYVDDAAKTAFLSCYSVTLNTVTIYYLSDNITVYFNAGENGALYARYIDPSGTEFSFINGSQISMDYGLKFVAEPVAGWSVNQWTVTVGQDPAQAAWYRTYGNTLEITETGMAGLKEASDDTLTVSVTFTSNTHKITYSAGEGGSLSATAGDDDLISGASVAHNATVTFTATPDDGKMVEKWTVDGAEYNWDGTDALYRENTLTLKNIDSAHTVQVFFTDKATTTVSVSAVDKNGAPYSGATVTVTDAEGNPLAGDALAAVPRSGALTFTAKIGNSSSAVVQEWQISTDGTNWTNVTGSGGKNTITIYEHGEALYVRVVIAVAQTYTLSWEIKMEDGSDVPAAANASLTAASNGVEIPTSGATLAANVPVDFTLTLADDYELVSWDGADMDPDDSGKASISSLTKDSTVTVTIRKKPTVTINYSVVNGSATGGELTAAVDDVALAYGSSVCYDRTVTFTAAPATGYRVKAWTLNGETWTDAGINTAATLDLSSYKDETERTATVTVEFMPIGNQITCSAGENGSIVSAKIGNDSYNFTNGFIAQANAEVVITAAPNTGYEVKAWSVNGVPVEGQTGNIFTYTADGTTGAVISVEFQCVAYTVNWTAENGTVTAEGRTGSSAQIRGGESVTFTANPGTGYVFDHWTVDGVEAEGVTDPSFTWTVPTGAKADTEYDICAVFVKANVEYTVTYSAGANGTISVPGGTNGSVTVVSGGSVTFTATPNASYMVKGWKVDGIDVPGSSNQKTYTLENVRENRTVTVEFETAAFMKVDFAVDGANGTLTAQADGESLTSGEYVSGGSKLVFTAAPAQGYMVESWTVNGETQSERSNTLTIDSLTGNVTVKVAFMKGIPLTINCGENGTLTIGRSGEKLTTGAVLRAGDTLTITAAPAGGYQLSSLTVNDAPISSGDSYTVAEGVTAVTVAAAFTQTSTPSGGGGGGGFGGGGITLTETVTIQDSVNGKVTADNTYAQKGDTVTLTVEPDKGYTLETLIVTDKNGDELKLTEKNGKYTFTMPAPKVTVKATFMEDNSMLNFFVDVPADAYYYDAVLWAAKEGITGGTDAVHFSPDVICTRAQAVTFLWRAAGCPAPESSEMPFTDVVEGSYYETAVLWAVENGITKGTSDTTFTPNATCTRAQIVTFLWRSQKSPTSGSVNPFTDVAADAYYADAVLWAVKEDITNGTSSTTFSPDADCTRAQIVTFLYRCMKQDEGDADKKLGFSLN